MSYKNIIKRYEDIALSNHDIMQLLDGRANIILYPNLHTYATLDEVLGPYGACVILYESQPRYGHWCCVFKINETDLEFFNPYGGWVDDALKHIPCHFRKVSNQCYPYLTYLLLKSSYRLFYNEFPLQQYKKNIRTCGRHCVVRLHKRNLDIYQYVDWLDMLANTLDMNYDEIVTLLTI
jgi:hypothetical protein